MRLIAKIFSYIHKKADHSNKSSRAKWKHAENRLIKKYCPDLWQMIKRGVKKEVI